MKKITKFVFIFCCLMFAVNSYAQHKIKGIAVYIDFSDAPAWVTPDRLDSLYNGITYGELGAERSIRAYWLQQSRGQIDFTFDIFYYRAPQPLAYYQANTWGPNVQMMRDALIWVAANHPEIDWNSYTRTNNEVLNTGLDDGYFQSVHFIPSADAPGFGGAHMFDWKAPNGVHTQKIESQILHQWWDETPVSISLTCHEMGHSVFGIPDTYDNDASSDGTGVYSLMSAGSPDAEPIGAPFLARYNWVHVIRPSGGTQKVKLIADGDSVVQYVNPYNPNEYFTVEARKKSTIGNSALKTDIGLLIWHSDEVAPNSNMMEAMTYKEHYRHSIEQADGKFDLERNNTNRGDAGDMYVQKKYFTNSTTPDSKWWDKKPSGFSVANIQIKGDTVSFDVTSPEPPVIHPKISQAGWTLKYTDSAESGAPATNAFDGDINTIWHTKWSSNETSHPHEIQINLGATYSLSGLDYTASKGGNGRIKDYEIFISTDGTNWGTAVAKGQFTNAEVAQRVNFDAKTGRYFRIVALSEINGNAWSTIAEINILGTKDLPSTGISEVKNPNQQYSIYPNPVKNQLFVKVDNSCDAAKIYSLSGSFTKQITVNKGVNSIDVTDLQWGMYFIQLDFADKIKTFKFIKN